MTTIVLVGGNGYIGREVTRQWLKRDPEAQIYVISRSDRQAIKDERIHHIQVDVNDATAFDIALPEKIDYIVNLTYGSMDAIKSIRDFAENHGAQAIGNIGVCDMKAPEFADFVNMKRNELNNLQAGTVRVENVDITVAYGVDRDDDIAKMIQAGHFDSASPIRVEIVACQLIDQLTKSWLA
ncbi:NAD-dependent epimerase/dehydratase family protein [Clostridium minihomine]|uniref:NAD-dependent epimerase/dehydratase family protein n=1 Tax=Clostridium minihomine TaxID=2045012 RepID=UPI000C772FBF|nr:NAD-dependent epimerase/dehydratase family protein [Clostridium minihomine]